MKAQALKEYNRSYKLRNAEAIKTQKKLYYQNNKEKFNRNQRPHKLHTLTESEKRKKKYARSVARRKERMLEDELFRLKEIIRVRAISAIKRCKSEKSDKTIRLLGCSVENVREHIQEAFTEGMTWELFMKGEIHVDHIIPIKHFDLKDPVEQSTAFYYKNLQPLWASENLSKNSSVRPQDMDRFLRDVGIERLPKSLRQLTPQ